MIPLARPYFDANEHLAVSEVLRSGMVSSGKKVEEFEEMVRRYVGAKYAVAVSSCTAGIYLALRNSVDLWDCNVAIPAFTFPAAQECVKHFSGEMAIEHIDVERDTYNINDDHLIERLSKLFETRNEIGAIIPIDQFGMSCNIDMINKSALKYANDDTIAVIRDSACALGSEYKGEKVGRRGTCVFSFHGRKIVTTGHGGMVCTDDEELYEKVLEGRQFGKDKTGKFVSSGLNFQLSDLQATIGIAQMEKLDEILRLREEIAHQYWRAITNTNIWTPNNTKTHVDSKTNWQSYIVRLQGVDRDLVMKRMLENGVQCQVGSYNWGGKECPVSEELAATALALPIWAGMSEEMIEHIVKELETCINNEAIHG